MSKEATREPKLPPSWFVHTFWRAHRMAYRLTGGRLLWTPASKRELYLEVVDERS